MTVGSKVKQTLITLKGAKSTLRLYSLQEQDKKASAVYKEAFEAVDVITNDLDKRIKFLEYEEPQYKGD
ncbi:DUF1657 domain-containing protein [Clostridium luticellarii]|uniref:DUF1657 domain-containing protein n=1 Tax=Clostridium luticellarii TaxID=1691940 RepID=A0A2T0BCN6_9CLOT|nr:DUF1657 domain-containing protein [Clostridium luticellarii]MCI1944143.1 DUF1657 domain-containing protein [Clostridium luticellarii]MCI1967645.1 DUF1657 domain-containing protein [Clostridium luticellarii]MCI1996353.1 DUF1657 domain-containing protein [Clostridium luticellarii]MCI2039954.1 DUF1657 domain-containing protein [Clostridium luticellarii]PRR81593.1 hypothetical protein CLLU_30800 [Clostridium luticellarii]